MNVILGKIRLNKTKTRLARMDWGNFFARFFSFRRLKSFTWSIVRGVLIAGISFYILYPLFLKISLAFMDKKDILDVTVTLIPRNFTLENLKVAFEYMKYPEAFINSMKLTLLTMVLQLISCTLAGYGFARFKFWGRELLFGLVILTLLVPPQTIIIPLYMKYRFFDIFGIFKILTGHNGMNFIDTFWPFIISSITCMGIRNGLYIYILRQSFRSMPKEIEEAALIDGAGMFRTFYKVMLPSAAPALITVILFSFVWQWNDIFYIGWYLTSMRVLPLQLDTLAMNIANYALTVQGSRAIDPTFLMLVNSTGALLLITPLIMLYIFAQKYFVESIERSGIIG